VNVYRSLLVDGSKASVDDGVHHDEHVHSTTEFPFLAPPDSEVREQSADDCSRQYLATLVMFSGTVAAHTGTGLAGGFVPGFMHPFTGLDHLLAMISVGLWGAFLGRHCFRRCRSFFQR